MPTIDAVVERAAAQKPDHIAIREWNGRELSYSRFNAAVSSFAAWVHAKGFKRGEAIAIHLPNSAAYLVAQFGSFRAAGVATYVNYRLMPGEALRQIALAKARFVVTTPAKAVEFLKHPEFVGKVLLVDGPAEKGINSLAEVMSSGLKADIDTQGLEDADAIIRFTSGSTGEPKGLIVTHRAWLIRAAAMLTEEMRIREGSTTLLMGQLSHQAGLFVIPSIMQRGTLLLMDKFTLDTVADILETKQAECAQIVPTMFTLIFGHARARAALAQSGLQRIVYGGSPIRQTVQQEAMDLLPKTDFVQVYGSHEGGSISFLDGAGHRDPQLRHGSGRPLLAVQLRLQETNADGIGEVEVKSPWLPNARLTAEGREDITDAWSRTGDLGQVMDGHVFLRDRMNDVIITGGFNVYPLEVEKVVGSHAHVLDAAVASAPDDKWGERVIAFIVPRSAQVFDEQSVRHHCKEHLATYKVPKEFRLIAEMPLNANGKPDRRSLNQLLWAGHDRRIN